MDSGCRSCWQFGCLGCFTHARPNCSIELRSYVADCGATECKDYSTLAEAEAACAADVGCGGITVGRGHPYQTRAGNTALPSPYGETSWLLQADPDCHPLPRLPNINYKPGVYIRLREQNASGIGLPQYFYADNSSLTPLETPQEVATFYAELKRWVHNSHRGHATPGVLCGTGPWHALTLP